jgi:predicted DNA-binding transcriptional regulator AlpA
MTAQNTYKAGESLMDLKELLGRLCVSRSTFYKHQSTLKARGLQEVRTSDKRRRFRRSSVDKLIARAVEHEEQLW